MNSYYFLKDRLITNHCKTKQSTQAHQKTESKQNHILVQGCSFSFEL